MYIPTAAHPARKGFRSLYRQGNYTAYGKYLLEGDMRVDVSSQFVPGQRYVVTLAPVR